MRWRACKQKRDFSSLDILNENRLLHKRLDTIFSIVNRNMDYSNRATPLAGVSPTGLLVMWHDWFFFLVLLSIFDLRWFVFVMRKLRPRVEAIHKSCVHHFCATQTLNMWWTGTMTSYVCDDGMCLSTKNFLQISWKHSPGFFSSFLSIDRFRKQRH